jgi:GNAT superfamily N-acetyltransferase
MSIEIRALAQDDLSVVHALFEAEFDSLPRGTLNPRSFESFAAILSPGAGAGVGAFDGPRLAGYAICEFHPWSGAPEPFALNDLLAPGETVAEVAGTLIDRNYRGHRLGPRLLTARRAVLEDLGVRHAVGMMLPDNIGSIVIYMRAGGLLCGIDHDDLGLPNFAHYTGELADREAGGTRVPATGFDEMRALFERGYVCRGIAWEMSPEGRRPVFEMTAEFVP